MFKYLWLSLVFFTFAGCSSLRFRVPPHGVLANGEPLAVRTVTTVSTSMERQEVGSVQYKDSSGYNAGSAKVYRDVPVTNYKYNWYLFQGENIVDDVDFYGIAGNEVAQKKAQAYRQSGLLYTWLGVGLAAAGLGTSAALMYAQTGYWSFTGVVVAAVGAAFGWIGQHRLAPENHAFDSVTAINTANNYNRSLGGQSMWSPNSR